MSDVITVLGLFLAFEGVLYAGFPGFVKRMAAEILHMHESTLRNGGLLALALGVLLVWLARG